MSSTVPGKLVEFLRGHERFFIAGHVEPDGDCIASSLALASYLGRVLGKTVTCHNVGPFNRREIAEYADEFSPRIDPDEITAAASPAAIILDCSGPDRIGALQDDIAGLPTAVIDHHATAQQFGDARFVVTTSMATCHLVQLLIEELGGGITTSEAQLLLFGIVTDTGFFRHAEDDAADLFAGVARLMEAGASPKTAHSWMFGGHTLDSRRLLASIMLRAESIGDGRGVVSWESIEDVQKYGKESRDSDTLYQLLFSIRGLRTAALIRQESETTVSGSLRSIDTIDVSAVAARFGGGGHKRAAGFTAELALDDALEQVRDALESALGST